MSEGLRILPVLGIGEVTPGADLAAMIVEAAPWLRDGDVLVVTSKIISKAEGRLVEVPADEPERGRARERILAEETVQVVARRGTTSIVRTRQGFVMAAGGIDGSNIDKTHLVLLPHDPDASARALRASLRARFDRDVAIVISDTAGRPWRHGLTDVALGAAGVPPLRDYRGETDPYGNDLQLTEMAIIDELAAAGELVKGKCDQVPVAVVRGYPAAGGPDGAGAAALVRDLDSDMFTLGTVEARAAGLTAAATLPDTRLRLAGPSNPSGPSGPSGPENFVDPAAVERALATVRDVIASGTVCIVAEPPTAATTPPAAANHPVQTRHPLGTQANTTEIWCRPPTDDPGALIRFGADVHRLRAALAAQGLASAMTTHGDGMLLTVCGVGHPPATSPQDPLRREPPVRQG